MPTPFLKTATALLVLSLGGPLAHTLPPVDPPPTATITPALRAGYVDADGVRRWTAIVDGVTTFTGKAPFFIEFWGGETTSTHPSCNTPESAWWRLRYLFDFGDARGTGNWSLSGRPKRYARGSPIIGIAVTEVGTHAMSMWVRSPAGDQTRIRWSVVATDPGAGIDMTPGVIPDFVANGTYNAPAGAVWGDITDQLDGVPNVLIRKTGVGADPMFGVINLDSRNNPNEVITRTAGFRMLNCDVTRVQSGNVGYDYCAFVGGRTRGVTCAPYRYGFDQIFVHGRTELQCNNIRYHRGLLLQDTGELNESIPPLYVNIMSGGGVHFCNVWSAKWTSTEHNIRGIYWMSSFRDSLFTNDLSSVSFFKLMGEDCTLGPSPGIPEPAIYDERCGDFATARNFGTPTYYTMVVDNQFNAAGTTKPVANVGCGPENNDPGNVGQGVGFSGYQHNRWWDENLYTIDLTGRALGAYDNLENMGAGNPVPISVGVATLRTPTNFAGPYFQNPTGLDPIPDEE